MMKNVEPLILLAGTLAGLLISGFHPHDRFTWFLEVLPVCIGIPVLVLTYKRFPLSRLLYRLLFLHALLLMIGGHYTYARVPLGFWIQDFFHFTRNHFDRLGHFAQGFVPAILAREILLRRSPLSAGKWLFFLVTCVCLAISACYEFVEWWTALLAKESAEAFLGTQGDVWDTQWDMFLALVGAITAQFTLARPHDKSLARAIQEERTYQYR